MDMVLGVCFLRYRLFIGNGLSTVPLATALRFEKRELDVVPIINDIFSQVLLFSDLESILASFRRNKIWFPFDLFIRNAQDMVDALEKGILTEVPYTFGTGAVPDRLKNAQVVINSFGPPRAFIQEQLSLLAPGGQLLMSEEDVLSQHHCYPDYRFEPLHDDAGDLRGARISRKY